MFGQEHDRAHNGSKFGCKRSLCCLHTCEQLVKNRTIGSIQLVYFEVLSPFPDGAGARLIQRKLALPMQSFVVIFDFPKPVIEKGNYMCSIIGLGYLVQNEILIFALDVIEAKSNRRLGSARRESPRPYHGQCLRLRQQIYDDSDVVISLALVEGVT